MAAPLQVLSSVLLCGGGNSLYFADVYFDHRIQKIAAHPTGAVEWRTIAEAEAFERVVSHAPVLTVPREALVFDGRGFLLIPGAVDAHVHFNTPGYEDREDFEHGSTAAVCGGVTTVADMPCTSVPPVTTRTNLQTKLEALNGRSRCDFLCWGGISAQMLRDPREAEKNIRELADTGVIGFKCYMTSGMDTFGDLCREELLLAARIVKTLGLPLAVHAEERELVRRRERNLRESGRTDWRAYAESRDVDSEEAAISILYDVCRETGCSIHIVHLSSARGLSWVARARAEGLPITAETCPHYLFFSEDDFEDPRISAFLKTAPPVKSAHDRAALWHGLADGTLSFVTTDHAGCDPAKEKASANFWDIYGGIPGVEHRVPYLLSEGFLSGRLTLEKCIDLLSGAPARFLGVSHRKGDLDPGCDADIVLINLRKQQTISGLAMRSKGKYTPFEGMTLNAVVERTWLRGCPVFDAREPDLETPFGGRWISRKDISS